jgi:N utilization substance protein B
MISRRLVRIKAMQTYYAFLQDGGELSITQIWNELERSINKSYELYINLHCLLISIFDFAEDRIEISKRKLVPSYEDLNPNTKFIDNRVIEAFRNEPTIKKYMSTSDYNWSEYPEFVKKLWQNIIMSDFYKKFMDSDKASIHEDVKILTKIISDILIENEELDEILEEKSIYWNDDKEFMLSNILQSIKKLNEENIQNYRLLAVFKNEDDEDFAKILIKKSALNKVKFDKIILDALQRWELDRIAFIDRVILHLALCEFIEMPTLPIKVTINEYLDIAKCYSTEKSNIFINGILDKIHVKLKSENLLNKKGLGLL